MTIEINPEDEEKLSRIVSSGRFQNVNAAIHEAINYLEQGACSSVLDRAPVWPAGVLRDAYLSERKEDELKFLEGNSFKVEEF